MLPRLDLLRRGAARNAGDIDSRTSHSLTLMSDSSFDESYPAPPALAAANIAEFQKTLQYHQLWGDRLQEENKTLKKELLAIRAELTVIRGKQKKKTVASTLSYVDALKDLGKQFSVTHRPWVPRHVFDLELPEGLANLGPMARFANEEAYDLATAQDLHVFVPAKYHADMHGLSEFRTSFILYVNSQPLFKGRRAARHKDPELLAYLKWPGETAYALMAPILYPDHTIKTPQTVFQSKLLVLVLRIILFSQTDSRGAPNNHTVGIIWNVKQVNASMIALAAIILRYVVSGDQAFHPVGARTKIHYQEDFRLYHRFFVKNADTPVVKRIFAYFNKYVFADIHKPCPAEADDGSSQPSGDQMEDFEAELIAALGGSLNLEDDEDEDDLGDGNDDNFDEFETGGHTSFFEGDEYFAESEPDSGPTTIIHISPQVPARALPTSTNPISQDPSSTRLVPPEAAIPAVINALPSAAALLARPRRPPTIIASTRPHPVVASSSNMQEPQPPPADATSRPKARATRSDAIAEPVAVLSAIAEEPLLAARPTRQKKSTASGSSSKAKKNMSEDFPAGDTGARKGAREAASGGKEKGTAIRKTRSTSPTRPVPAGSDAPNAHRRLAQYWRLLAHQLAFAGSSDLSVAELTLLHSGVHVKRRFGTLKYTARRQQQGIRACICTDDQAVKSLCDIWRPEDIPQPFITGRCSSTTDLPPTKRQAPSMATWPPTLTRNLQQLPSPITPSHPSPESSSFPATPEHFQPPQLVPLKGFVHEVLRRSRTSGTVLQTALCYLEAIRVKVPELVEKEKNCTGVQGEVDISHRIVQGDLEAEEWRELALDSVMADFIPLDVAVDRDATPTTKALEYQVAVHPVSIPVPTLTTASLKSHVAQQNLAKKPTVLNGPLRVSPMPLLPSPLLCPRRTFLASLILASKFTQDRCYSNKAPLVAKLAAANARWAMRSIDACGSASHPTPAPRLELEYRPVRVSPVTPASKTLSPIWHPPFLGDYGGSQRIPERASQIQAYIARQEAQAMNLNANRGGIEQHLFMSKMQALATEVRHKKELLQKLLAAMAQAAQQQGAGPSPGMVSSPAPQHQQVGLSQGQPALMAQHGTAQAQGLQMARAALPSPGPSQPQNLQPSPQIHAAAQSQKNGMDVPQRPGSTIAPRQLPNQAAQFMQQQQAQQQAQQQHAAMQQQAQSQQPNRMQSQTLPPPLDKAKFEESYAVFRSNRPMNINEQMMQIDNRPIDLYSLHYHVLSEGGGNKVTRSELWPALGARERLRHIYAVYLQEFKTNDVRSALQKKGMFPGGGSPPSNGNLPGNSSQMNPAAAPTFSAAQNTMMMYTHLPTALLHARGVPDNVICFVKANRANSQCSHLSATMKQSQKRPKDQQCQFCHKLYAKNGIATHVKSCAANYADVIRDTAFRMDGTSVRAADNQSHPSDSHQDSLQPQYTEPADDAEFLDFSGSPNEPTTSLPEPLETRKDDIRTEYHPRTGRAARVARFDEYGREETTPSTRPIDETPWAPFFRTRLDFELAEVMQEAALNREQISRLISLIHQAGSHKDGQGFTITSYSDLKTSWDNAAAVLSTPHDMDQAVLSTPFIPRTVSVPYKQSERSYDLHFRPLMRWALSLVDHPRLAHEFRWDAERISKFDGHKWQRVYHEPWTAEDWWSTQSAIPEKASPLCFILYADKTKLSSFGTEKGYPIIARIANLPIHIRNSNGLGGGQVVGWLPIISEDAGETGKTGFVNHKNAVWHASFREFMEDAAMHSSTGLHHVCGDDIERWLFPIVLILSADYEEQYGKILAFLCLNSNIGRRCIMALIRGLRGKCPCPKCLVLAEHLSDLSGNPTPRSAADTMEVLDRVSKMTKEEAEKILKPLGLRNVQNAFFKMIHSDVNHALSFDRLHTDQGGLFGDHQWPQIKLHIQSLGRKAIQAVDEYIDSVPRWRDLNHFKSIMQLTVFATQSVLTEDACPVGYLLLRCLRAFLVFDMYAALEVHTEDTITLGREAVTNFGILMKEYIKATDGMEKFGDKSWDFIKAHLPKHIFDDVVGKGATRNYNTKPNEKLHGPLKNAYRDRTNFKNVAQQILKVEEHSTASRLIRADITELNQHHENSSPAVDMPDDVDAFLGFSLGSKQKPCTIQKLVETAHNDNAFSEFRVRLQKFLSAALGITVKLQDNSIISEYRFLKVDFAHAVDWRTAEDYLRCNPTFHGHPRYDSVIYPTDKGLVFAQLILLFNCTVADATHSIALVQPYDEHIPASERPKKDRDLGLLRYRARRRKFSEFISVSSIIRGALLVQDPDVPDERFVVDVVDTDMFLRLQPLHRITPDSS
ncbi:hypothetical protein HWV62_15663 [Athelia sp. TMB]|nr:hypothetical protein HWV62_15663 [Athelia sp. TMB]